MARFLGHWVTVTLALAVSVWVLPGVEVTSWVPLVIGGLVLGFVNATVRPILTILTLPLTILTLGLFYLLVNGFAFSVRLTCLDCTASFFIVSGKFRLRY